MKMSIKAQGRKLEKKVVRGSKTAGRDVKLGMGVAGRKIASGARTVGKDVSRAGKRVSTMTRHGAHRFENRVRSSRRARATRS
ncbi:MAG: hypothetical protein L3K19_03485 [Thermoplasmata archaeon]|nr:hypothetical protein [Thermoplasmata archaeon]